MSLIKTFQCSPLVPSSLSAEIETSFWHTFGEQLTKSGFVFPPENEIAFQYVMANRINEQRSFFTRFVAVTPVTDRPIIIIGNSFAKNLIGTLSKKFGFNNTFFFEVRNTSLSDDYLRSLSEVIKGNQNAFNSDSIIIFCGMGNSLLKARGNRSLDVLGGQPIHISGQVSQLSDIEFEKKILAVRDFLVDLEKPSIFVPPFPRHFSRCCVDFNHFDRDFTGAEFVKDVRDWGTFMAMSRELRPINGPPMFIPFLPSIFGDRMLKDGFTGSDGVHLSHYFVNLFHEAVADMARSVCANIDPPHVLPVSIPSGVELGAWKEAYRTKFSSDLPQVVATERSLPSNVFGNNPRRGGHKEYMGKKTFYSKRFNPTR